MKRLLLLLPSYNHVIDGLIRVVREEGPGKLYNGAQWAISRCVFVSIGQMPFYDVVKQSLLGTGYFQDNTKTHLLSSLTAVSVGLSETDGCHSAHSFRSPDLLFWPFFAGSCGNNVHHAAGRVQNARHERQAGRVQRLSHIHKHNFSS